MSYVHNRSCVKGLTSQDMATMISGAFSLEVVASLFEPDQEWRDGQRWPGIELLRVEKLPRGTVLKRADFFTEWSDRAP